MPDDIEKVRKSEERRGKRPVDLEMRNRRDALVRKILESATLDEMEAAMREYGIYPNSAQWTEILSIWRGE